MSKKRAYGQLSVRAHVGDDAHISLFSGGKNAIMCRPLFVFHSSRD